MPAMAEATTQTRWVAQAGGHQVRHGAEAARIGRPAGAAELHDADGAGLDMGAPGNEKARVGFAGLRSEEGIQVRCPARRCAWWW